MTNPSEDTRASTYRVLHARLAAVRRKDNVGRLLYGVATSGVICIAAILLALVAEGNLRLAVVPRTLLVVVLSILGAFLFVFRIVLPAGRIWGILPSEGDIQTARRVGDALPHLKDRVTNAVQLCLSADVGELYSRELVDAALKDTINICEGIDFASTVSFSNSRRWRWMLVISIAAAICLFDLYPTTFFGAGYRLVHFQETFNFPASFKFIVQPGNKQLIKGESVTVHIAVEGRSFDEITIRSREHDQKVEEEKVVAARPDGSFRYEFKDIRSTIYYAPQADGIRGEQDTLTVIDRPVIKKLQLTITPPSYSHLPEKRLEDNVGDVSALKGSRVHFKIDANKELRTARVTSNNGEFDSLSILGASGVGAETLMKEHTYHLDLLDKEGIASTDPVEYAMKILPDENPSITLLQPTENLDVTDTTAISLLVKIADDYGFSGLRLGFKLIQSKYESPALSYTYLPLPLPARGVTEALIPYSWHIAKLHLVPEDVVSYHVEVFDNDLVSGPKTARSEEYLIRLPSLDEIFADADKGHEASIEDMRNTLEQAQAAHKDLEDLKRSLLTNQGKMDWQDRQKSEELIKKYTDVQGRLDSVRRTIDKLTENLQKNNVLSKETAEKYQELRQLMDQLSSPELADALRKLQEAMQQMNPDAIKQAMSQMSLSEDILRKSIERTLSLLRRLQVDQKMDETARRAEEMAKQQEDVSQKTAQTQSNDHDEIKKLTQDQEQVLDKLTGLRQNINALQEKMREFPTEMPLSEMEQMQQQLQDSALEKSMEQAVKDLQDARPDRAREMEAQAAKAGAQLAQRLREMQRSMRQSQQRENVKTLRTAMRDLLELSERQEKLKDATQALDPNSGMFRDDAESQMEIMNDLGTVTGKLGDLSKKTFSVTPEMGKSIGDALRQMEGAMQSIEQRNRNSALERQTDAMGSLNEATQRVEDAINAMEQGGGQGLGMAGLMQRLERMASMQRQINEGTKGLGGMSAEQAAEMSRLAGEQAMVRKSLEELAREAAASGNLKRLLGDLTDLAKQMVEVQTDLSGSQVSPQTVSKEDRILSRLLDAQRSTRTRDYERQRTSTSGKTVVALPPKPIDPSTMEGRDRLRRDLQKALDEGYSREFEDLIKRYFDMLGQIEPSAK